MAHSASLHAGSDVPLHNGTKQLAATSKSDTKADTKAATAGTIGFQELSIGTAITIAGLKWAAQTQCVQAGPGGTYRFSAKAGERASFDPPRKIRTELVGLTPFAKGQEIRLTGTFNIDPKSVFVGAEWCSIVQIHQADTRRADGSFVNASPLFSLDLVPDPATGRPYLRVLGETGRGEQKTFSPTRILGTLPQVELGKDHHLDLIVVDGHGDRGRIAVWIDGEVLVDRADIPTGYEYVDLLADAYRVGDRPQPTAAYLKIGIYAGKSTGDVPPEAVNVALTFAEAPR
ncbi:heparin lyase I family protein [Methylobacterium haplocladii]|uniref:heparin lyase I family protein n=2 Tax=Methylobacterium haplocladii TaxID=1176176 RepID=UPI0027BA0E43|nr:heparin lyase I family protein [Methylobacterium haplocladii]